jgi:hypothetical protein
MRQILRSQVKPEGRTNLQRSIKSYYEMLYSSLLLLLAAPFALAKCKCVSRGLIKLIIGD